jgi:hypothetical protein
MSAKNIKTKEIKNLAVLHTASKSTSEAIKFPSVHSTSSDKIVTLNSKSFTRYSLDDNGGGYLGL